MKNRLIPDANKLSVEDYLVKYVLYHLCVQHDLPMSLSDNWEQSKPGLNYYPGPKRAYIQNWLNSLSKVEKLLYEIED